MLKNLLHKVLGDTSQTEERYARFLDFCKALKKAGFKDMKPLVRGLRHDHLIETEITGTPGSDEASYCVGILGRTTELSKYASYYNGRRKSISVYSAKALSITFNAQAVVLDDFDGCVQIMRGKSLPLLGSNERSRGIEKKCGGSSNQTIFSGVDRYEKAGQAVKAWVSRHA